MDDVRPFDSLPDELLHHIMLRCGPSELSRCEQVCRRWRSCAASGGESAWLLHTAQLWRRTGWTHNVPCALPLTERLRKLPVSLMRQVLSRYDTAGLVEKIEWMRLLRVELLWPRASLTGTVCKRSPRGLVAPSWALNIDDCKAAFMFATIEIARPTPLESQLLQHEWDLIYNNHPGSSFDIQFFDNKEMTASSHPGARFRWRLRRDGDQPGLEIENFPLHTFSRAADGLWCITNPWVTIKQRAASLHELPLFDPAV
jgi:hypothetical protein